MFPDFMTLLKIIQEIKKSDSKKWKFSLSTCYQGNIMACLHYIVHATVLSLLSSTYHAVITFV